MKLRNTIVWVLDRPPMGENDSCLAELEFVKLSSAISSGLCPRLHSGADMIVKAEGIECEHAQTKPFELTIEIARSIDAGDPHAFRFRPQTYNIRKEDGTYTTSLFLWEPDLLAQLAELRKPLPDPVVRQGLGERLRSFIGETQWETCESAILEASKGKRLTHVTIRSGAAETYALPWDLLTIRKTGEHLGELPGCLLRYEWTGTETAIPIPFPPTEQGRILLAWSAAGGAVPAAEHSASLRSACGLGLYPFDETRDVLAHASRASIYKQLVAPGPPVVVLHILCHGGRIVSETEAYGLIWDDFEQPGATEIIDAAALRQLLKPFVSTLRLVVLSACHASSTGEIGNSLGGLAQALHRIGIPAVVASRQPLSVAASILLVNTLYERLLVGLTSLEDAFLAVRAAATNRRSVADLAALQLYARATDGWDHRPIVVRPYRGLLAFDQAHSRFFFGRTSEIDLTVSSLHRLIAKRKPRFLLVTGASGTGKSSFVLAGVVPALQDRGGDEGSWTVFIMRPRDGLPAIETALEARKTRDNRLLLIVDQFEEIFTDIEDGDVRQSLVSRLWSLSCTPKGGVSVIVTLRIDFLGRCGEIELSAGTLYLDGIAYDEAHRVFTPRMTHENLAQIIRKPAERVGLCLEDGLAEQMLKDAGQEPGALPLLEYTLDQLWLLRERHGDRYLLTWKAYNQLGGITGALRKKANELVAAFDPVRQAATRRLLVQLVDSGDDKTLDTRRRVPKAALRLGPEQEAAVFDDVLQTLTSERLVVLSEHPSIVEISHEQLVRSWDTLREWLRLDRSKLRELEPFRQWAEMAATSRNYLLTGDQLVRARELLSKYVEDLSSEERNLILRSIAEDRRRRRWSRATVVAVGLMALIMGVLALVTWRRGITAQELTISARSASLMAGAREALSGGDPTLASQLLCEVNSPDETRGWRQLAYTVLNTTISLNVLRGHRAAVFSATFSPDGRRLVTGSEDGTARVWELDGSGMFRELNGHNGPIRSARFSPDGKRVISSSKDGTAQVWGLDGSDQSLVLNGRAMSLSSATFSSDGKYVVTTSHDKIARVWALDGSRQFLELKGHSDWVNSAAFSPDGKRIITTSNDNTARVWELDGSGKFLELKGHSAWIDSAEFSPDGERVITTSMDNTARIWELDGSGKFLAFRRYSAFGNSQAFSPDGKRVVFAEGSNKTARVWELGDPNHSLELKGHSGDVFSATFSPDGRRVVTASEDRTARVWELDGSGNFLELKGHTSWVYAATFSPDGKRVVTASHDNTVRVWEPGAFGAFLKLKGHARRVNSAAFSSDGRRVVTASQDQTARVWELDGSGKFLELKGHTSWVSSATFSPDNMSVVTASYDKTARVWDLDGSGWFLEFKGHTGKVNSATFSPDGGRIVTASQDKTARVWELDGSGRFLELKGHTKSVNSAAFSSDGRHILTESDDKTARVWDLDGSSRYLEFKEDSDSIESATFSPDARRIVTASERGKVRVWELDGSGKSLELKGHAGRVYCATFSLDGKRVVTASADTTARVWELSDSGKSWRLPHILEVKSAQFSPNNNRVVTTTQDNTARIWDLNGPGEILELTRYTGSVHSAMVSPEGSRIFSPSTLRWELALEEDDSGETFELIERTSYVKLAIFSPDGKHVLTATDDDGLRLWTVSGLLLQQLLQSATTDCLWPGLREQFLAEGKVEAQVRYEACARRNRLLHIGKRPLSDENR